MSLNLQDGWGHTLTDDSTSGLIRELTGMLNNDKHEQFMEQFNQQYEAEFSQSMWKKG